MFVGESLNKHGLRHIICHRNVAISRIIKYHNLKPNNQHDKQLLILSLILICNFCVRKSHNLRKLFTISLCDACLH